MVINKDRKRHAKSHQKCLLAVFLRYARKTGVAFIAFLIPVLLKGEGNRQKNISHLQLITH